MQKPFSQQWQKLILQILYTTFKKETRFAILSFAMKLNISRIQISNSKLTMEEKTV